MFYHFKIHKDADGLWAECVELNGCVTQADSMDELEKNMKEVLDLYLDESPFTETVDPLPKKKIKITNNIRKVQVSPEVAFSVLLRFYRKKHKLSQKELARLLGVKNIFSYQRLEKKSNPRLTTLAKIKEIFPEFSIDQVF